MLLPTITYGSETWALTIKERTKYDDLDVSEINVAYEVMREAS